MIFFYTTYEYILANSTITTTLKGEEQVTTCDLYITTPAVKFLGLPIGGGLVKMSRLYTTEGKLIHARNYSPELKQRIKALKKTLKIPYLKLWKGFVILSGIAVVGFAAFALKMRNDAAKSQQETKRLTDAIQQLKAGQLYGVSFFTDGNGNSLQGLPAGWIRIEKLEGDTIFVRRSKREVRDKALFHMADLATIKPASEEEWNSSIEKVNYALLKEKLHTEGKDRFDLIYIGPMHKKYSGVIMTVKGVE